MNDSLHKRLRALIGQDFNYLGKRWTLIEILSAEDLVVLRSRDDRDHPPVQADIYGSPLRRSQETLSLPISGPEGDFSEEIHNLLATRLGTDKG